MQVTQVTDLYKGTTSVTAPCTGGTNCANAYKVHICISWAPP